MATIRSSAPSTVTSTPVRWGRVSSREADRATRPTVSTKAPAGTFSESSGGGSGQLGEVLGREGPQVEHRAAGYDLHVLLRGAVLEREVVARQRADHVEQEPAGDHDGAVGGVGGLERDAHAELHVGGLELERCPPDTRR